MGLRGDKVPDPQHQEPLRLEVESAPLLWVIATQTESHGRPQRPKSGPRGSEIQFSSSSRPGSWSVGSCRPDQSLSHLQPIAARESSSGDTRFQLTEVKKDLPYHFCPPIKLYLATFLNAFISTSPFTHVKAAHYSCISEFQQTTTLKMCVCVCLCTHASAKARRGVRFPRAGVTSSCEPHGCCDLNSGPLQEQEVLSTSDPLSIPNQ